MSVLPVISGLICVSTLEKLGYQFIRQKGSHIIMRRNEPFSQITVPEHRVLDRGTLRNIIKQTGLSVDDFKSII